MENRSFMLRDVFDFNLNQACRLSCACAENANWLQIPSEFVKYLAHPARHDAN